MPRPLKPYFFALIAFSALGMLFAGISTYDFVAHLDRQVHSITCSFIPGLSAPDTAGTSGCHAVMISPWSSVFRSNTWGGLPISLPAMAVFAYLLFVSVELFLRKQEDDPQETRYLLAATLLPLLTSLVYLGISTLIIKAVCKLCIGVYVSSLAVFVAALFAHLEASRRKDHPAPSTLPWPRYGIYFLEGVIFVATPVVLYMVFKPAYTDAMANCGRLSSPEDKYSVMVPLNRGSTGIESIEVLDPLCSACKAFDQRLKASGMADRLKLSAVLFPLDNTCNWMVPQALHPGACAVSEAVLCSSDNPTPVLNWAFEHQDELRSIAEKDPKAIYARITQDFPKLASCVGKPDVKSKLNKSMRWAVNNALPVVTPQLYIQGEKLCDEDTDIGLEFALKRKLDLLAGSQSGRNP